MFFRMWNTLETLVNLFVFMNLESLMIIISGVQVYCEFSILQLIYRFFNSCQKFFNQEERFEVLHSIIVYIATG